jgi:hypothetical protein
VHRHPTPQISDAHSRGTLTRVPHDGDPMSAWVISRHPDKSASCPLYPQQRKLGGTSKPASGSLDPRLSYTIHPSSRAVSLAAGLVSPAVMVSATMGRAMARCDPQSAKSELKGLQRAMTIMEVQFRRKLDRMSSSEIHAYMVTIS